MSKKVSKAVQEVRENKDYTPFIEGLSDDAILAAILNLDSDADLRYPTFVTMPVEAKDALKDYLLRTHEYNIADFVSTFYELALTLNTNLLQIAYKHLAEDLEDSEDVFILKYKPYNIRVHKNDLLNTLKKPLLANNAFIDEAAGEIIQTLEGLGFSDYALKIKETQKVVVVKTNNFKGEKYTKQMM